MNSILHSATTVGAYLAKKLNLRLYSLTLIFPWGDLRTDPHGPLRSPMADNDQGMPFELFPHS